MNRETLIITLNKSMEPYVAIQELVKSMIDNFNANRPVDDPIWGEAKGKANKLSQFFAKTTCEQLDLLKELKEQVGYFHGYDDLVRYAEELVIRLSPRSKRAREFKAKHKEDDRRRAPNWIKVEHSTFFKRMASTILRDAELGLRFENLRRLDSEDPDFVMLYDPGRLGVLKDTPSLSKEMLNSIPLGSVIRDATKKGPVVYFKAARHSFLEFGSLAAPGGRFEGAHYSKDIYDVFRRLDLNHVGDHRLIPLLVRNKKSL